MTRKYILSLAAATIGSGLIAVTAAHAFGGPGGHGQHHGSGAVKACIAVMNSDQRAGLKTIFVDEKGDLIPAHQKVRADKQALELAILNKGDVGGAENTLATDKAALQKAEDGLAVKICAILTDKQPAAAVTLYNGLTALHQSTHEQARTLFKDARTAAGDPPNAVQSQGNPAQGAE
jgi:hypothetical protein